MPLDLLKHNRMKNFIGYYHAGKDRKKIEKLLGKKKSAATLTAELQKIFNTYIRLRDTKYNKGQPYFICISCKKEKALDEMHAGHFFAVGSFPNLRFHEHNVNGQCRYCNYFKHGNPVAYQKNLILKIGQENFDKLDSAAGMRFSKRMPFELEVLIETYKQKVEELKKSSHQSK
jgi:hypothetical protein